MQQLLASSPMPCLQLVAVKRGHQLRLDDLSPALLAKLDLHCSIHISCKGRQQAHIACIFKLSAFNAYLQREGVETEIV